MQKIITGAMFLTCLIQTTYASICDRTIQIQHDIIEEIGEKYKWDGWVTVNKRYLNCEEVTEKHLEDVLFLDLNNKGIEGMLLSQDLEGLPNLHRLILSNNNIDFLPDTIGDLESVTIIDVSDNQLTSIPDVVVKLQKLEILDVSANPLTLSSIPDTLKNRENLQIYANDILPESPFQQLVNMYAQSVRPDPDTIVNSILEGNCYIKAYPGIVMEAAFFMTKQHDNMYVFFIPFGSGTPDTLMNNSFSQLGSLEDTEINILGGILPNGESMSGAKIRFFADGSDSYLVSLVGEKNDPAMACYYSTTFLDSSPSENLVL